MNSRCKNCDNICKPPYKCTVCKHVTQYNVDLSNEDLLLFMQKEFGVKVTEDEVRCKIRGYKDRENENLNTKSPSNQESSI